MMTDKNTRKKIKKVYDNVDFFLTHLTGCGLKENVKKASVALIETIDSKIHEEAAAGAAPGSTSAKLEKAYLTLHCMASDDDSKIMEMFKDLTKIFHPEIGSRPNEAEFYRIVDSYNRIMKDRHPEIDAEE
jgi:hypothetical protein